MKNCRSRRNNSGQVLIIVSLIITMLLLSTALYVIEIEKTNMPHETVVINVLSSYKLGTMHTLISALANISNGGNTGILAADLNQFKSVVTAQSYNAIFKMSYTLRDVTPYQNGVWLSWGSSGTGISSTHVNFALNSSETSAVYYSEYSVNITSEINISGDYVLLTETLKQVNVTCRILNEGKPAMAQNFTVYYELDGNLATEEWIKVASPDMADYGNGTYQVSFNAQTKNQDDPMLISVHCHDLRGIFVRANVTGTRV